jgi:hypothetical protein
MLWTCNLLQAIGQHPRRHPFLRNRNHAPVFRGEREAGTGLASWSEIGLLPGENLSRNRP